MNSFITHWQNRSIAICFDVLMIPITWLSVYLLYSNFEFEIIPIGSLIFLISIQVAAFFACGLYRGIWRFAAIPDLFRILRAVIIGTTSISIYFYLINISIPIAAYVIYAMSLMFLLSGQRILYRWMKDYRHLFNTGQRVLIVGAGSAGEGIVRDLLRLSDKKYQPICFVDDDESRHGREIHGVRVVGGCEKISLWVQKYQIELILIAVPSAASTDMRRIVKYCEQANVPFRTLPGLQDFADGTVSINALRPVLLVDLLGREQATLDWEQIHHVICNKKVLVSGGGGSIGSELCRQIAMLYPSELIIIDSNEYNLYAIEMDLNNNFPHISVHCLLCSVTDRVGIKTIFTKYHPQLVFHAAAYKHVPLLETQLRVAMYNNIIGTRIISETAAQFYAEQFILISTDKAVNPTNIMGATKRVAEVICQNLNFHSQTNFITVRFGNVLDSAGSVVPLFRKQLLQGGPLTVTHPDITRFFMTISEATQLILQAASMGQGGEIFILDMGEPVKINYLAEQMIKLSGKVLGVDIQIQYTGLRPGEKLFEELFHQSEILSTTSHPKINQSPVRRHDWSVLCELLNEIEISYDHNDDIKLRDLLCALVPEYTPQAASQPISSLLKSDVCSKKSLSYV